MRDNNTEGKPSKCIHEQITPIAERPKAAGRTCSPEQRWRSFLKLKSRFHLQRDKIKQDWSANAKESECHVNDGTCFAVRFVARVRFEQRGDFPASDFLGHVERCLALQEACSAAHARVSLE